MLDALGGRASLAAEFSDGASECSIASQCHGHAVIGDLRQATNDLPAYLQIGIVERRAQRCRGQGALAGRNHPNEPAANGRRPREIEQSIGELTGHSGAKRSQCLHGFGSQAPIRQQRDDEGRERRIRSAQGKLDACHVLREQVRQHAGVVVLSACNQLGGGLGWQRCERSLARCFGQ
ncbi:MAG: hypothetical protein WDO74_25950 [Pseudomonadota bacterium]